MPAYRETGAHYYGHKALHYEFIIAFGSVTGGVI